ncbi:MAG: glycosyltransferase family 39 protein [Candidatus Eisenbacteria bacterium]|nr:glycosyltransferase family 39 protein [Candidatus Eisenbacteria bacterium]
MPDAAAIGDGEQGRVGEAFMRLNADRYHRVFFAARAVIVALSLLVGVVVWRWASRRYGRRGGLFALALWALAPEALAHAGVATLDVATALGFAASVYAFWMFARSGRWSWWGAAQLAVAATCLTRFSAVLLAPMLVILAALGAIAGRWRKPRRVWLGLALLPVGALIALAIAYRGGVSFAPLAAWTFDSPSLRGLQRLAPWLRLPLPDLFIGGFDRQLVESGRGVTPTYLLGTIDPEAPWTYFPIALAVKWPLAFIAALAWRIVRAMRARPSRGRAVDDAFVLAPALIYLGVAMFFSRLGIGVRYVLPILPFLCVWCGGAIPRTIATARAAVAKGRAAVAKGRRAARRTLAGAERIALALVAVLAVETATTAPWYLAFFNAAAGGPGNGDRIVNDSNVDWGQGLIALRDEMRRRGIARVHLAYLGTTDPAVYGVDYVPYLGGRPGPESEWLAVSSYYFVGLSQRMMTTRGRTEPLRMDFRPLWSTPPVARPARCMYLFRVR